jgi:hypothetical protein
VVVSCRSACLLLLTKDCPLIVAQTPILKRDDRTTKLPNHDKFATAVRAVESLLRVERAEFGVPAACAEELLSCCFSFHRFGFGKARCESRVLVSILLIWARCCHVVRHSFVQLAIANMPDPSLNVENSNACDRSPSSSETDGMVQSRMTVIRLGSWPHRVGRLLPDFCYQLHMQYAL